MKFRHYKTGIFLLINKIVMPKSFKCLFTVSILFSCYLFFGSQAGATVKTKRKAPTLSIKVLPVGQPVILHAYTTAQFPIMGGWVPEYNAIVGHRYIVSGSTTYVVDGVTYVVYTLFPYLLSDPGAMWPESALSLAFGGGISRR